MPLSAPLSDVRVSAPMGLGITGALVTGAGVAIAVHQLLFTNFIPGLASRDVILLAAGAGAVGAETAGAAVQWVAARWSAKGPITDLLVQNAAGDTGTSEGTADTGN